MSIIRKLPAHISNLIAAGEVVERPSSVIKELMENSIDAGANMVTVEIRNGGIDSVRVIDNGCGMNAEDARNCFLRHATSKTYTEEDLIAITHLGFRGEALAAISAVSKIELVTRTPDSDLGVRLVLHAGEIISEEETGCPVGTSITVSEIFYNTPARMKFLKKNTTEASYAQSIIGRIALSHPEVSVKFIKDGRVALHTPGDNSLKSAIHSVCGREFTQTLLKLPEPDGNVTSGLTVWGYITDPSDCLATRNSQYFILNGRCIRSKTLAAALEEVYRNTQMSGKYPGCVIHCAIDPAAVDVNVHPAKLEVKFADERNAFHALYSAALDVLNNRDPIVGGKEETIIEEEKEIEKEEPIIIEVEANKKKDYQPDDEYQEIKNTPSSSERPMIHNTIKPLMERPVYRVGNVEIPLADGTSPKLKIHSPEAEEIEDEPKEEIQITIMPEPEPEQEEIEKTDELQMRVAGELYNTYIIVELPEEVILIDKHAAHERIIFNRLIKTESHDAPQILLDPIILTMSAEDIARLDENREVFSEAGLLAEAFGDDSVIIREIPSCVDVEDVSDLIGDLLKISYSNGSTSMRDDILHSIACKAAIKAGKSSDIRELEHLARQVLTSTDVRNCPHGRPVLTSMSKKEIAKGFRR